MSDFVISVAEQTYRDFQFVVCDDLSSDNSRTLFLQLCSQYEIPVVQMTCFEERHGIVASYAFLLQQTKSDYVCLADQDDVWMPCKLEKMLSCIREQEKLVGKKTPLLVHSDLYVYREKDETSYPSFWKYQTLKPQKNCIKDLIIQNNVTGCAMICNKALIEMAFLPQDAICHDWYLALIASAFGKIAFIEEPLVCYRQHANNFLGAVPRWKLLKIAFDRQQLHERLVLTQKQALAFLKQFRNQLKPEQIRILEIWGQEIPVQHYWKRLLLVLKYNFRKNDRLRTFGMWWAL